MAQVLSPLSLGELLDRTFQLYRRHFVMFVGIAALPHVLLLPVQLGQLWFHDNRITLSFALWMLGVGALGFVATALAQGASVVAVSQLYLERSISINDAYARVIGRLGRLCGLLLVAGIAIAFGFLLLIIPGVLLLLRWSLAVPSMILEELTIGDSLRRSSSLTKDDRFRIFGIYFLYFVLTMIMSSLWQMPVFIAAVAAGRAAINPPFWTQVLVVFGSFVTISLVSPLMTIALSLVYYDERVRKEAFDLDHLMAQIDASAPPTAALPA
jgi:hypothetical protein